MAEDKDTRAGGSGKKSGKVHIVEYIGKDPFIVVDQIGEFKLATDSDPDANKMEIGEDMIGYIRGVRRGDLFLIDGKPSYEPSKAELEAMQPPPRRKMSYKDRLKAAAEAQKIAKKEHAPLPEDVKQTLDTEAEATKIAEEEAADEKDAKKAAAKKGGK